VDPTTGVVAVSWQDARGSETGEDVNKFGVFLDPREFNDFFRAPITIASIWGVSPNDFALSWVDGQGAAGYTGLTLHATAAGVPTASLTLTGFTSADLTDGKLTVSYGTTPASGGVPGSTYMYVHAN
jgi:hypothetical protein